MRYYLEAWKKALDYAGRAHRAEFWHFVMGNVLVAGALLLVDRAMGTTATWVGREVGVLSGLYGLASLLPAIALTVRRLHDTGRDGRWVLISPVPIVGQLILFTFMIDDTKPGTNAWGPAPESA